MLNKTKLNILGIWVVGWMIFGLVEIVVRIVDQITFPWYKGESLLLIYILILSAYACLGTFFGFIALLINNFTRNVSVLRFTQEKPFSFAICQTVIIFVFLIYLTAMLPVGPKLIYLVGVIAICSALFAAAITFFKKRLGIGELWWRFIFFCLLMDIIVVGGNYILKIVKMEKMNPLNETLGFFVGVCVLIFIGYKFMRPCAALLTRIALRLYPRNSIILFSTAGILIVALFAIIQLSPSISVKKLEKDAKPNVIVITMDTTRPDHLSCYGYEKKTTPSLDKLAEESMIFSNAYSTSSWTLPAHASLFTGLYPTSHEASQSGSSILDEKYLTLTEILFQQGYATAGVIGGHFCSSYFGMNQGFDYFDENLINLWSTVKNFLLLDIGFEISSKLLGANKDFFEQYGFFGKRIAPQINNSAIKWLKRNHQKPFFLFLNYFDAHSPYLPINDQNIPAPESLNLKKGNYLWWEHRLIRGVMKKKHILQPAEKAFLLDRYDADIKQMDQGIGELIATLKELEAYDNTLIVITSDHGESFGEHGMMTHTPVLYEDQVKVPLIVKYPKQKKKVGRYAGLVSIVDIMPEILTVLEMEIPQDIQGIPFYQANRRIFAERRKGGAWKWTAYNFTERSLIALYDGDYKFIWASNQQHELYNIVEDPLETTNLMSKRPDIVDTMESAVQDYLRTAEAKGKSAHSMSPITKEVTEALKALGYVR